MKWGTNKVVVKKKKKTSPNWRSGVDDVLTHSSFMRCTHHTIPPTIYRWLEFNHLTALDMGVFDKTTALTHL